MWSNLDLLSSLARLSDTVHHRKVLSMLEQPLFAVPELLVLGLASLASERWTSLHEEVLPPLIARFIVAGPNSSTVLHRVYQAQPAVVLQCLIQWFSAQPNSTRLARVLDVVQDIKALPSLLSSTTYPFVLDLAILASHREFLKLDLWLSERLRQPDRDECARSCVQLLRRRAGMSPLDLTNAPSGSVGTGIIVGCLQAVLPELGEATATNVRSFLASYKPAPGGAAADVAPLATPGTPTTGIPSPTPGSAAAAAAAAAADDIFERNFSQDVDDTANSYFQKIYTGKMSIEEVIDLLAAFKSSPQQKEQDVHACMIRNLFDEYRFFPQYPDKELGITGILFGSLVQHRLVKDNSRGLGYALRYVLDALRKEPTSKMHRFGLCALGRFKDRLSEWPQYCAHICQIPHFATFPTDLQQACQAGKVAVGGSAIPAGERRLVVGDGVSSLPAARSFEQAAGGVSLAKTTNINTLLTAAEQTDYAKPSEAIEEKVHFIFNNLSAENMDSKADELCEIVGRELLAWLAQYIVVKRASIENNFHDMYISFLDALNMPDFRKLVLKETLNNVRVLLKSHKIGASSNSSERSLLKNLGSWLGLQTLARNKPILHKDLALKELVLFAYEMGPSNLLYVIPFVCKVLQACRLSRVFRPPNPWLMATLSVLRELHLLPKLKLNLKFEIEVLCKDLQLNIEDIPASNLLREIQQRQAHMAAAQQHAGAAAAAMAGQIPPSPQQHMRPPMPGSPGDVGALGVGAGGEKLLMAQAPPNAGAQAVPHLAIPPSERPSSFAGLNPGNMASMAPHILVNQAIPLFQQQPQLKQFVQPALEQAVQEIITPVVERSMKIACISAQKLVTKDFALEGDESKLRKAAHAMVQHLAGSLAMVTSKEPLRISITNHMRTLLMNNIATNEGKPNQQQVALIDQAVGVATFDNLELGCAFIEKTAMERSVPAIDEVLAADYQERLRFRETASDGRPFHDSKSHGPGINLLPPQLRPKPGGLSATQLTLYENFTRGAANGGGMQSASSTPLQAGSSPGAALGASPQGGEGGPVRQQSAASSGAPLPSPGGKGRAEGGAGEGGAPPASAAGAGAPGANSAAAAVAALDASLQELEALAARYAGRELSSLPVDHELPKMLGEVQAVVTQRCTGRPDLVSRLCQRLLTALLDTESTPAKSVVAIRDVHVALLQHINRAFHTVKELTRLFMFMEGDRKLNLEVVARLLRMRLLDAQETDMFFVRVMDNGRNYRLVVFVEEVLRQTLVMEPRLPTLTPNDFSQSIELLNRIAQASQPPRDSQVALLEAMQQLRKGPWKDGFLARHVGADPDPSDPEGLHDNVAFLLEEWIRVVNQTSAPGGLDKPAVHFIRRIMQQGMLKTDDISTRFFRLCITFSIRLCFATGMETEMVSMQNEITNYQGVDALSKLVIMLLKNFGESSKVALLSKVLTTIIGVLVRDHNRLQLSFNQKPYYRLLANLLADIDLSGEDTISIQYLMHFSQAFRMLRPELVSGFTFAWVDLISHRKFMSSLLLLKNSKSWHMLAKLMSDLLTFIAPYLREGRITPSIRLLYKGTLRILLVLLHDFPEFLADFSHTFCDVIPPSCVQMRNLVLSAFPRNMRLPDPFTSNLQVELLPEISQLPTILSLYQQDLQKHGLKADLDAFLQTRQAGTFLSGLRARLLASPEQAALMGCKYNTPLLNAVVLYVGVRTVEMAQESGGAPAAAITRGPAIDIFKQLMFEDFDPECTNLVASAIANQLRFPNALTHIMSVLTLFLFAEAPADDIKELITSVLLSRLVCSRPHSWGLLVTFLELISGKTNFWSQKFVVDAVPEVRRLFDSVARSCLQPRGGAAPAAQGPPAGGPPRQMSQPVS